jgi:hypothetical protein
MCSIPQRTRPIAACQRRKIRREEEEEGGRRELVKD